jgi:RHS repeat-associated protein
MMSNTQPVLSLEAGADSLNIWMREDGLRIDRLLLVTDTNYIPTGSGPAVSTFQLITHSVAAQTNSHVIHYTYDDLYRLTQATYSGDINAEYNYAYDPVGNMTAYTEAVGTETTHVTRTFDDANRLQTTSDFDQGTTSYLYDNNGNLTLVMPPGGESWLHYEYDQRNLMISHTLSISGTAPQLQAAYSYDGSSNRVQQVDHTGTTPITTTYTNDIVGLSQVLVADNGNSQTHMLYGLDLISQDDGNETRYLLADGLGSVRVEMVDDTIETTTTYAPFGNLLQQTGSSGTVYGFTGEQYDTSTEQLYLRARYYNPTLHAFMGKDPWNGNSVRRNP